jgi:probable lipoprotein NlpC
LKKWFFLLLLTSVGLASCSSTKTAIKTTKRGATKIDKIISNALKYKGVPYKFGGTSKRGMDCSGIVYISYLQENTPLPRVSRDMAKKGKTVSLKSAKKGDLLFFKTSKRRNRINHVGLIISVKKNQIRFIHATTSRGVITSLLSDTYWKSAFVKVKRIL